MSDLSTIEQLSNGQLDRHTTEKAVAKQPTERKLIGRYRMRKGHTMFEYDLEKEELRQAEMEVRTIYCNAATGKCRTKMEIVRKKRCLYLSALNRKNAYKKLRKLGIA